MKTPTRKLFLLLAVLFSFSFAAKAQFIVTIRPSIPVIVRPMAPSPRHVWVDGDWAWRGGRYEYVNGYWMVPARPGLGAGALETIPPGLGVETRPLEIKIP